MENELLYRLALARVQGIGAMRAKILIRHFGDASTIFRSPAGTLEKIRGIGESRARSIRDFKDFHAVEKELAFLEKYKIRPLFFTDAAYPLRLNECRNAPPLLFYKGAADLNAHKILSVVGTRTPTEYGRQLTDRIIKELSLPGLLIVSGLAYGIDATAHKAALRHHLPTIGVLGHGLDRIYPEQHAGLAREMVKEGGLLTEFTSGTQPAEHNFPTRNRIVAGMSDALLVIETGCRGGSMLTVENATNCGKKVFAVPGRITDAKSAGCNALIKYGKAILFTGSKQLLQEMQWLEQPADRPVSGCPSPRPEPLHSKSLRSDLSRLNPARSDPFRSDPFPSNSYSSAAPPSEPTLSSEEKILLDLLRATGGLSMDELLVKDNLGGNQVSLTLLTLEMQGLIRCLPGKRYIPA